MNTYPNFSFNLASAFLQNRAKETVCVSPVSLLLPLAAVASASEGGTKDEFAKVLGDSVNDPSGFCVICTRSARCLTTALPCAS